MAWVGPLVGQRPGQVGRVPARDQGQVDAEFGAQQFSEMAQLRHLTCSGYDAVAARQVGADPDQRHVARERNPARNLQRMLREHAFSEVPQLHHQDNIVNLPLGSGGDG